jgi:Mg-chelatase subunit ChlD
MIRFTSPWALVLVPLILPALWWGRRVSYVNLTRARRRLSLTLRTALTLVLVLSLAGPLVRTPGTAPLVLLVDVSRSVTQRMLAAEQQLVGKVWDSRGAPFEVVTFAGRPQRAALDGAARPRLERHDADATDLAAAVRYARAISTERPPHIVVVGDGHVTRGDERRAIEEVAAAGGEVDVFRLQANPVDARVSAIRLPEVVRRHEPARMGVVIESTRADQASVKVQENELLIDRRTVSLKAGTQELSFDFDPSLSGFIRYGAEVKLDGDEIVDNDLFVQVKQVGGPPRVLLVAATPAEGVHLEEALVAQEINVELTSPAALPTSVETLLGYDEVLLVGIAPHEIDRLRQSALAAYVRDTGGGLLFVSGPRGLRRDPQGGTHVLESLLPLDLAAPNERQEPPVAMVLLIDQSGSMIGDKLDHAKQAALAVIERLTEHDQIGIIAFDSKFTWLVPMTPLNDKERIKAAVGGIGAGGGTRFYPALEEAYFALGSTEATVRHVVLLTDGDTTDPNIFPELLAKFRAASVTVSTVAIGQKADVKLLALIAKLGGGRFTLATTAAEVPNIFVKETETIQHDAAQRGDTRPSVVGAARELAGIDWSSAPPLKGYLRTRAKAGAEVLLEAGRDPLLARWRYGLGTVVAFASDATTAWSELWLSQRWSGFGKLWTQLVRGVQRPRGHHDLSLTMTPRAGRLPLTVEAIDTGGRFIDGLDVRVRILEGEQHTREVPLEQVGPGRYFTEVEDGTESLLGRALATSGGRRLDGDWEVVARPYPAELLRTGVNDEQLDRIASWGRGHRLTGADEITAEAKAALPAPTSVALPLQLLALLLFLADLITKRARWEGRR